MSDYPIEKGVFIKAFRTMPKDFLLPFKSSEQIDGQVVIGGEVKWTIPNAPSPAPVKPSKKNKVKYTCPRCTCNAWGKPKLDLLCYAL